MNFSDTEIANAVQARLAQLDGNNDLPFVLMPLDPEIHSDFQNSDNGSEHAD